MSLLSLLTTPWLLQANLCRSWLSKPSPLGTPFDAQCDGTKRTRDTRRGSPAEPSSYSVEFLDSTGSPGMDCFQEKPHPKRLNELKLDLEIQVTRSGTSCGLLMNQTPLAGWMTIFKHLRMDRIG